MKVQAHNNRLETNSESESKSFGIGDASVVIEILRNRLYENKIQTCVQEYICNARDAMREVGKGNNFRVTMPTRLAPTFKVRDFGPGISPERMEKVFILYGASTKRGTNNQTGGFGIGAKSAWSYTDSFTVVTVIDGTRRTYVCHTGHNNQGSLDLVATDKTDEPNGTEIQIAVKHHDLQEFQSAIYRAIYFWNERPEVNSTDGLPTLTPGYKLSDNVELIQRNAMPDFIGLDYNAKALAVIDGVAYPITEKLLNKASKLANFIRESVLQTVVLHFANGIVEVSASRESIADSQFTVDALNRMGAKGAELVKGHLKSEFAKVNSVASWLETYRRLKGHFHVDSESKYGDYKIESDTIVSDSLKQVKMTVAHNLDKRGRYTVDRITKDERTNERVKYIPIDLLDQVYVVTKTETAIVQNKRLRAFLKGKPAQLSKVIMLEYGAGDPAVLDGIVKDLGVKVFETLEFVEEPKAPKEKIEREKEEFCFHRFTGTKYNYTSLEKNTKKFLYVELKDGSYEGFNEGDLGNLSYHLRENSDEKWEVIGIAGRGLKLVQGNENFKPLKEWLASYKPSKAEVNYAVAERVKNTQSMEVIIGMDGLKDEFLVAMADEYKGILSGKRKVREIPSLLADKVQAESEVKDFFERDEKLTTLINDTYPLVKELSRYTSNKKELAFYINAKYSN